MEIALSAVTDAGRSRMAAVTAEVGAHVVLLAAQQVAPRPFHVTADSVLLSDTGEVRLLPLAEASPHEVEMELRRLLAELLGLSPTAPPAFKAAAERSSGGGLEALEAELHAALIPINHAAARRALARLFRETRRASGTAGSVDVTPTFAAEVTPVPRAVATTPAPGGAVAEQGLARAQPMLLGAAPAAPAQADLDIDVDVVDDESSNAAPSGEAQVVEVALAHVDQHVAHRSDVRELLASFLSHTRSEERMSEELRRMLGVERGPSRVTCFANAVVGPDGDPRR